MKTDYKRNPKKVLGYFMALVMVFFSTSSSFAEDLIITVGGGSWTSEVSWDITDASGASITGVQYVGTVNVTIPSGCYDMNMYDSFGDGWNGSTYSITDSATGQIYATGGLLAGAYGVDQVCWGVTGGCTDSNATNYDPNAAFDDGSCTYASCTDLYLSMYDSFGDGWNGNTFTLTNSAGVVSFSATLATGASGLDSVCLPDDCYTVSCGGGSWAAEVSWSLADATGAVLASGGSPAAGTVCLPALFGCTDPNASNYDPNANTDDGSCSYPCISGDTTESFEVNFGAWYNDPANTLNWTIDAAGTPSSSTGPSAAFDGVNYIYTETSGGGSNSTAAINTDCIDLSAWTDPAFVFAYHMYGATMGTINVDVSTDGGATWTNEWTLSGDQGNAWYEAVVNLSAYSGQVSVRVQALTGTSFTSDMAVDLLRFMEAPTTGCTDPFASNYDPLATLDDGSCLYPGCMDPLATNYCSSCNVNDSASCIYPQSNSLDFCDDFESASFSTNGWTTVAGSEPGCVVQLTTANAIADTVSIEMTGADGPAGWTQYSTEAQAFANVSHVSSATVLMDMSANTGIVNLGFDYQTQSGFTNTATGLNGTAYSTMRVKVNGTVLTDVNGVSWHGSESLTSLTYDLSSYAGQSSVYITFEAALKYNSNYSSGAYGDFVWIDNVCVFEVNPCTYYGIAEDYAFDASCNGGTDGMASCTAFGDAAFTYNHSYSWTDAAGTVVGTTGAVTGLAAGTYTCTATDATNGCTASTTVTIGEPTAIVGSGLIVDATSPINTDGSVDLTVAGGSPCYAGAADTLNTHDGGTSYIYSSVATGTTVYFDITAVNACGITALTQYGVYMGAGDLEVWTRSGSADGYCQSSAGWTLNTSIPNSATVNGQTMHIPLMSAIGMEAGDVVGIALHTPTTHYFTLGGNAAFTNVHASDANIQVSTGVVDANGPTFGGSAFLGGATASYNPQVDVHYTSPQYTYAWSNGATTQDVSGLGMGPIAVTITDCNGCTGTWSGFVAANVVNGCTDPNASNFDPLANTDDGSCLYPGCTDSLATNFDPNANVSDSSCTYSCAYQGYSNEINLTVFTDLYGNEASWSIIDFNGDTVGAVNAGGYAATSAMYNYTLCADDGCYTMNWGDTWGDGWVDFNGTQGYIMATDVNGNLLDSIAVTGANANGSVTLSLGSGVTCIAGCTDSTAVNYDPTATFDDGSCAYCTDNFLTLNMYDSWGDGWNGNYFSMTNSAGAQFVYSTLASGSFGSENLCLATDCWTVSCDGGSFQSEVSWELVDASGTIVLQGGAPFTGTVCLPAIPGCMDSTACNYDPLANTDNGTCDFSCYGCTDPTALNYDPTMTIDDGSCYYCSLSASTTVVDETAAGAFDGAVDLTVTGTYCVTTTDLFVSVAGGNGQAGNAFNLINTSGSDLYIDGFSQGPGSGNASIPGVSMEVFCAYEDYTSPSGTLTWTSVATAVVDLTAGATTGYIQIPGGVTIPAGGTYGFWVGSSSGTTVQYTNGTGTVGVTPWASDANVTVTEGHGGTYPTGLNFSPRNWNGTVHYGDPNATVYTYLWNTGDTTEDLSNVTSGTYTVSVTDCMGCTTTASATVTVNMVPGCTDPLAFNYNPAANFDDGSCIPVVNGCTDTAAANYDSTANTDDGSCHYCFGSNWVNIDCGGGSWQAEVSWDLLDASGTIILSGGAPFSLDTCLDDGCYTIDMYDSFGDGWNGNTFTITDITSGVSVSAGLATGSFANANLSSAALGCYIYGCTDPLALNYDANANTDDGSCTYPACVTSLPWSEDFETGMADVSLTAGSAAISTIDSNNNVTATNTYTWHGQGNTPAWGATPTSGANAFATKPNNIATMALCVDLTAYAGQPVNISFDLRQEYSFNPNYSYFRLADDTGAVLLDGNGVDYFQPTTVCSDPWVNVSYDLSAYAGTVVNLQFQSCNKYYDDYYQCGDNAYVDNIVIDIQATPVYGCTDSAAVNYDPAANTDDGSCCYGNWATLNMFDSFGDGWNGNYFTMTDVVSGSVVFNETLASGTSGTADGCVPTGCYDIVVNGGSWQSEVSWNLDDGTGNIVASGGAPYSGQVALGDSNACSLGCTDPTALNYDSTAIYDDGSCAYPCLDNSVYISVNTDYYGTECSWDITDASGAVVASGGPYAIGYNVVSDSACLTDGCYTLNMYDSYGDGWSIGQLGSVDVTDGMGGTYAAGTLPTGTSGSWDFTVGTVYGCTDTAATNYDACANADDGSCVYPCNDNDVTIVVGGGSYASEVGWSLVDGSGTVVASATAPAGTGTWTACLPDDCYTMNMTDTWGDGWNGNTYTITDNNTGTVYGTGTLASGSAGSESVSIGTACPVYGCTDSTAINYDPLADTDDGSCIYPLPCNGDSFCDDFESGSFTAGNWIASSGLEATVAVTMTNPNGTMSAEFQGGNYIGWLGGSSTTTSAQAWSNTEHISQIEMCLDLSTVAAGSQLSMVLDYNSQSYFGATSGNYSWFRVLVDGDSIADQNGNYDHNAPGSLNLAYDLSAYAGGNPTVTLQASCKYGDVYSGGAYNDYVWVDNLCIVSPVYGCTDSIATNYDPLATIDDGSCTYPACAAPAPYHQEYSTGFLPLGFCTPNQWATSQTSGDGWRFTGNPGWHAASNGRTAGTYAWIDFSGTDAGIIMEVEDVDASTLTTPTLYFDYYSDFGANGTPGSNVANTMYVEAYDGSAWNVVATMQMDVPGWNTYSYSLSGFLNNGIAEIRFRAESSGLSSDYYNDLLVDDVKVEDYSVLPVYGCTDSTATNYDPLADTDDGSCVYPCLDNSVALNMYDSFGDGWNGSTYNVSSGGVSVATGGLLSGTFGSDTLCLPTGCYDIVVGGGSWTSEVSFDFGSLVGAGVGTYTDISIGGAQCGPGGCTDSTAFNYDPNAAWDDGSCIAVVLGCTDSTAFNYNAAANTDDGSCVPVLFGCTDSTAANYYSAANTDDGSCIYPGCTDSTASNYDPTANLNDGSCTYDVYGCTDPLATNYDPLATIDDGTCQYPNTCGAVTGINLTDVIHDRVVFNWDDMNQGSCVVDQIRIRYREVGTNSYSNKTMGAPVGNNAPCLNTSKLILNLNPSTQYEYDFKIWYQGGPTVNWHGNGTFTTAPLCDNVTNVTATPDNTTKTTFCWDTVSTYEFVRLQYRENVPGSSFSNIGGFGVFSPLTCKAKNGLTPGTQYRVMWRTWCNATGGPYRSPVWDGPVIWDQPTSIRLDGGTAINNLDVYPNPSRDIFNVSFTSEDVQNLEVRIINVIGEVVYTENLIEFVGEYTKQVDLSTYTKGVYFLEITTDNGVVNKKLILQ